VIFIAWFCGETKIKCFELEAFGIAFAIIGVLSSVLNVALETELTALIVARR
jgi:hypothetical protein